MRMKNPAHPGELVEANPNELGLSVAEAAKTIGVTCQQLYNVIKRQKRGDAGNGRALREGVRRQRRLVAEDAGGP
jgi:hypothetical protein